MNYLFVCCVCFASLYFIPVHCNNDVGKCHSYTTDANKTCCMCSPGYHLVNDCVASGQQAICKPCQENHFQTVYNRAASCAICSDCNYHHQEVWKNCTKTNNTQCQCVKGRYFLRHTTEEGICLKHTPCGEGEGVVKNGTRWTNTECKPCADGVNFSNTVSLVESCWPCTSCVDPEREEQPCTQKRDTICRTPTEKGKPTIEEAWFWIVVVGILALIVVCLIGVCRCRRHKRLCFSSEESDGIAKVLKTIKCRRCCPTYKHSLRVHSPSISSTKQLVLAGTSQDVIHERHPNGKDVVDPKPNQPRPTVRYARVRSVSEGVQQDNFGGEALGIPSQDEVINNLAATSMPSCYDNVSFSESVVMNVEQLRRASIRNEAEDSDERSRSEQNRIVTRASIESAQHNVYSNPSSSLRPTDALPSVKAQGASSLQHIATSPICNCGKWMKFIRDLSHNVDPNKFNFVYRELFDGSGIRDLKADTIITQFECDFPKVVERQYQLLFKWTQLMGNNCDETYIRSSLLSVGDGDGVKFIDTFISEHCADRNP